MTNAPIRKGDTVLVRLKVQVALDSVDIAGDVLECVGVESHRPCAVYRADVAVVEHRDFQPGDKVTLPPKISQLQHVWKIVAIEDGHAWLKREIGGSTLRMTAHIEDLRAAP
jgi:hypothetical protein